MSIGDIYYGERNESEKLMEWIKRNLDNLGNLQGGNVTQEKVDLLLKVNDRLREAHKLLTDSRFSLIK